MSCATGHVRLSRRPAPKRRGEFRQFCEYQQIILHPPAPLHIPTRQRCVRQSPPEAFATKKEDDPKPQGSRVILAVTKGGGVKPRRVQNGRLPGKLPVVYPADAGVGV